MVIVGGPLVIIYGSIGSEPGRGARILLRQRPLFSQRARARARVKVVEGTTVGSCEWRVRQASSCCGRDV